MITLRGCIVAGSFVFNTKDRKKKQEDFAKKNEGKDFEILIKALSKAEYYQHKYYRGILLPSIYHYMEDLGETDKYYIHNFIVKKQFLFYEIKDNDVSVIPSSHKENMIVLYNNKDSVNKTTGEITEKQVITGYIRSTGTLDFDEFRGFIKDVENWLYNDLQYQILPEKQEEAKELKAIMNSGLLAEEVVDCDKELFAFDN